MGGIIHGVWAENEFREIISFSNKILYHILLIFFFEFPNKILCYKYFQNSIFTCRVHVTWVEI